MRNLKMAALVALTIALASCGGGLSQDDVDAAVDAAVEEALASTSTTEVPLTTTEAFATTTEATTTTTRAPTTTTRAPTTTTRAPTTTTRAPTTTSTLPDVDATDFFVEIDVLSSSCFGSAGANVEFEVGWGWPGEVYGTLTYEIRGLDDGAVNIDTTEIMGTQYGVNTHHVGIPTCDPESIVVVPTKFRADSAGGV